MVAGVFSFLFLHFEEKNQYPFHEERKTETFGYPKDKIENHKIINRHILKREVSFKKGQEDIIKNDTKSQIDSVPISISPNKTFLICIDPGHQEKASLEKEPIGPNSQVTKIKVSGGTAGVSTRKPEHILTMEASIILGQLLEKKGFEVIFTRKSANVNLSNRERAMIANGNNADLFIRIHADGSTNKNVRGFSILTPSKNNIYTKSIFQDSLKSSQYILNEVSKKDGIQVNGLSYRDDMSGFNWSHVPTTLIEMGFMTNPAEDKDLSNRVYLTNLLSGVADGIEDYAKEKSTPN
jgi:N-acetylmuramoyl-L-alanine amidase